MVNLMKVEVRRSARHIRKVSMEQLSIPQPMVPNFQKAVTGGTTVVLRELFILEKLLKVGIVE